LSLSQNPSEQQSEKVSMADLGQHLDNQKSYWDFEDGQVRTGQFKDEDVELVTNTYTGTKDRYRFNLTDLQSGVAKQWTVSKTVAGQIQKCIAKGNNIITVSRRGTGKQTEYVIIKSEGGEE